MEHEAGTTRHRPHAGFTLVEVVLVVAIVGIIAAIAVPRFNHTLVHLRVDNAARRLVADLDLARRDAQATSSSRTVTVNATSETYTLVGMQSLDAAANAYTVDLMRAPYHAQILSVSFGGSDNVTFDGFGKPDSGGTVAVGTSAYQRIVTLDANSGRASLQ